MTDEELDEARAKAAWDCQVEDGCRMKWSGLPNEVCAAVIRAARYGRENWTPADPDLVLAREVAASEQDRRGWEAVALQFRKGALDDDIIITTALAAIRAARGEGK